MTATPGPLIGREEERKVLDGLLDAVRDGLSGALVLAGEAGIGKTRLLEYAAGAATDLRTARLVGIETEAQLSFAALHRLLLPFLDGLDRLPDPQRTALKAAFGLRAGPPADRFLVGLAALTLLSDAAGAKPLMFLVDDAQWMDRESVEALAFVGHRLHADGIGLLFAVRTGGTTALDGLPVLELAGLSEQDASALLAATSTGRLGRRAVTRAVTETGGNPLALIELAGKLTGAPLPPAPLPLSRRMEAHFLRQVRALPERTQSLLLLVSLAPPDDPQVLWRAAGLLDLPPAAADAAVSAGILVPERGLVFRHPLIRSAVHGGARTAERRRVHRTLAAAIDRDRDPDRRAWHLAEATAGIDEAVAGELDRASERARARGGYSAQAMFLSRAAELTPDPRDRAERLFAAAQSHLVAGDPVPAETLLRRATDEVPDPLMRVRAEQLRARIEMFFLRVAGVPATLLAAAGEGGAADERLARVMRLEALQAALLARRRITGTTLTEVARAVLQTAAPTATLLDGLAVRVVHGYEPAVPVLRSAITAMLAADDLRETGAPLAIMASVAAEEVWDDRARRALLDRISRVDRDQGALYALRTTLLGLATSEVWAGRFTAAEACYAEMEEIVAVAGLPPQGPVHQVELLAWQGREADARSAARLANLFVEQTGLGVMTNRVLHALAVLELSLGRYDEALAHALPVYADDPPAYGNLVLPLIVEAGVRAGDRRAAGQALARLAERAPVSGTPWALGLHARCRALLTDDGGAEELYREAVDRLGRTLVVTELARSHLLYGEWLRRRRRRIDARVQLRTAHEMFVAMGAAGFAERARTELLATGEHARKRDPRTENDLTAQENRIAGLAASGSTNAEIATRLFITASTVEYHLNKIFRKLGITSRRQLLLTLRGDTLPED